ncbi:tyrosine-type recombinase/integrase [Lacticaseibacillus absianus]|uniref:tyrosine-type recombinase/integrase n=1 Tax=Lacticaseibacillus absianus TaxID=2729623 RepID=UPI0015CC75AA
MLTSVRGIVGTRAAGNRKDVRRVFDKKKDAVSFAANLDLDDGRRAEEEKKITLPAYYDKWIAAFKLGRASASTDEWYQVVSGYLHEWFDAERPGMMLSEVDKTTYQAFLDWCATNPRGKRRTPLTRSTVDKINSQVRGIISDAVEDGYTTRDFTRRAIIDGAASKDESEKYVSVKEFKAMIKLATKYADMAHMSNYIAVFMAYTGARFEEALGVTWENIDFEARTVTFEHSWQYKTRKQTDNFGPLKNKQSYRTITVPPKLIALLKQLRLRQQELFLADGWRDPDDLVFRNVQHRIIGNEAMNKTVKGLCASVGAKNTITSHGLRHSHGSMLLFEGVELLSISRRLGHGSLAITMKVYLHEVDELKQRDDKKIARALEAL